MVYNTQDYKIFGLCLSSSILKSHSNITFRQVDLFPSSGEGRVLQKELTSITGQTMSV
jgi:hypothetical protein